MNLIMTPAILASIAVVVAMQTPPAADAVKMSQRDFTRLAAAQKILIVDVRPATAFTDGHIPRAISLPLKKALWPGAYAETIARLKAAGKPVVIYCACSGETLSLELAGMLNEQGVTDTHVLVGGWNTWANAGNRIAKGPK